MSATTALRREHDHIMTMITCLRVACEAAHTHGRFDTGTFRTGVDFIRGYADAWHHAKEEQHLFPALAAAGMPRDTGPVAVMLHEHAMGRTYVKQIAANLDAAEAGDDEARATVLRFTLAYAELLTNHIAKENGILFNMADQVLDPDTQAALEREYETAIPEGATPDTGARYEEMVTALCQKLGLDPVEAADSGTGFTCG